MARLAPKKEEGSMRNDGRGVNNSNSGREILRSAVYTMSAETSSKKKKKKSRLRFKEWMDGQQICLPIKGSPEETT